MSDTTSRLILNTHALKYIVAALYVTMEPEKKKGFDALLVELVATHHDDTESNAVKREVLDEIGKILKSLAG